MGTRLSQTTLHFSTPAYSGGREGGISCSHQILGVVYHRSRSVHCPSPFGNLLLSRASLHIMQVKPSGFVPRCQNLQGYVIISDTKSPKKGSIHKWGPTNFKWNLGHSLYMMDDDIDDSKLSNHRLVTNNPVSLPISSITAVTTSALTSCFPKKSGNKYGWPCRFCLVDGNCGNRLPKPEPEM